MKEKWEKSCGTLHTLPEPPPSVDGGKKGGLAVMGNITASSSLMK